MREFNCAYCGRKAIDKGPRQNAKYCSQACNQLSYYYRQKEVPRIVIPCKYNDGVICDLADCAKCGWDPEVEKRRKELLWNRGKRND